ncbi:hypothetical protein M434DRAFT_153822 [Hypoxylon sp. CO27-5]|nr:hypothetical protein M434DRAFT_153822 [Hypoxylon sp. CO27-5]
MLNKYASPEDESFKTVSSTLLELSIEAQKEFRSKLSLANDPIGLQIANWLKSSPVKIEHDSQIDTLVFKARMLEKLGNSENLKSTSILAKVTSKARRDISQNAQGLSLVLNTTAGIAEKPPADAAFASEIARKTIYEMRSKVEEFCQSARDGILLDPQINLEDAIEDEITLAIDAKSDIDLRQCVLETSDPSEDGQLPNTRITYVPGQSSGTALARLRYGYYQKKYLVIVESFPYTPTSGTTDMPPDTLIKTRRMIERLSHPNRTSKHVLPCFGYIQDRYRKQIEVVFSVGEGYDVRKNPTSLYDLYSKMNRVPLGLRFKLAHSLATAVEGLHRVGWVHEELKSKNFILLERTNPGTAQPGYLNGSNLDFDNPYLLGFKWSRPADAETDLRSDFSLENNAYRHPDRWGKPVRFTKAHDIYSLGVIFFELVQWKPVTYRFKILEGQPLGSEDLKKEILATTQRDVSHMAGQSIADVIETCLNFDTLTKGLDQFEAHCIFKEKILGVVTRLARADI